MFVLLHLWVVGSIRGIQVYIYCVRIATLAPLT